MIHPVFSPPDPPWTINPVGRPGRVGDFDLQRCWDKYKYIFRSKTFVVYRGGEATL
jgi:hypothetical protein